jgi:3-deoxy-D-manno-octulosonic-acid transferase
MQLSPKHKALMAAYRVAWLAALPFLSRHRRLRKGFRERLAPQGWAGTRGWADIWVQAASGGEAYLAWELMRRLPDSPAASVLATTNTVQGMEILEQAQAWREEHRPGPATECAWFPFDTPGAMQRALYMTLPKVVVLLETELWPGLLATCAREDVPVLVVNGRMTSKSLAGYLTLGGFFKAVAPREVLAVSETDALRFGALFGHERVSVMPNMKFDRLPDEGPDAVAPAESNPLEQVVGANTSFCVLGSVRAEEERDVLRMLTRLQEERPKTTLGLFPRHLERVAEWERLLRRAGLAMARRSKLTEPAPAGSVILWDTFGELGAAYGLARAAFVGGSLRPLGGQNFLEPLTHGLVPCIGPYWSNFAWVGRDIVDQGLVREAAGPDDAVEQLLLLLKRPQARETVAERAKQFFDERRGGTDMAVQRIMPYVRSGRVD